MLNKNYFKIIIPAYFLVVSCKSSFIYQCDCNGKKLKVSYDYFPSQKIGVSDKDFKGGIAMLKQVYPDYKFKEQFPAKKKEFSYANPWNLAVAFSRLQEKELMFCMLKKAEEEDILGLAYQFKRINDSHSEKAMLHLTKQEIDSLTKRYQPYFDQIPKEQTSTTGSTIWQKDTLDQELVSLMRSIVKQDQKYRSEGIDFYKRKLKLQNELDSLNQAKIDSLYKSYGTYVGKSLVGESTEYAMWTVIQHASLEKQEFYLPIVQKAVENFELKGTPFKMLIDRVYHRKFGYQIFGSQSGVALGSKKQIKKAKKKFNLE